MGRTHAVSGAATWLTGCALAAACGAPPSVAVAVSGTVVTAGFALWPDIDHPCASVSISCGPLSRLLSRAIAGGSAWVHARTRTAVDRPDRDGHRTVTHTALWALVTAAAVAILADLGGRFAAPAIMFVAALLGLRGMTGFRGRRFRLPRWPRGGDFTGQVGRWLKRLASNAWNGVDPCGLPALALTLLCSWWLPAPGVAWLALSAGLGSLVHCAGDAVTRSGCPVLWPLKVKGRRWYPVAPALRWRVYTGSGAETTYYLWPLTAQAVAAGGALAVLLGAA